MRIFAKVPGVGRQTTVGLSTRQFSAFSRAIFFGYFRDEACVIIRRYAVRRRIFSDPKMNDYFELNSVFAPVWMAQNVRLRKIIA